MVVLMGYLRVFSAADVDRHEFRREIHAGIARKQGPVQNGERTAEIQPLPDGGNAAGRTGDKAAFEPPGTKVIRRNLEDSLHGLVI